MTKKELNEMSIKELDALWTKAPKEDKPMIEKVIETRIDAGEKPQDGGESDKEEQKNSIKKAFDVLGL